MGTRVAAAELRAPTNDVGGIFAGWSAASWDFGAADQFPALHGRTENGGLRGALLCEQPAPRAQCSSTDRGGGRPIIHETAECAAAPSTSCVTELGRDFQQRNRLRRR